jgi:hypothetical protein
MTDTEEKQIELEKASEQAAKWLMRIADFMARKLVSKSPHEWPPFLRQSKDQETLPE